MIELDWNPWNAQVTRPFLNNLCRKNNWEYLPNDMIPKFIRNGALGVIKSLVLIQLVFQKFAVNPIFFRLSLDHLFFWVAMQEHVNRKTVIWTVLVLKMSVHVFNDDVLQCSISNSIIRNTYIRTESSYAYLLIYIYIVHEKKKLNRNLCTTSWTNDIRDSHVMM